MSISDKDNPRTWRAYAPSLCQSCMATCCTMPAEVELQDLVRLGFVEADEFESSPRKTVQRLTKEKIIRSYREKTGLFILDQKSNGDCVLLDSQTRLCTVYENRPQMCRDFPTRKGRKLNHCPYIKK